MHCKRLPVAVSRKVVIISMYAFMARSRVWDAGGSMDTGCMAGEGFAQQFNRLNAVNANTEFLCGGFDNAMGMDL